MTANQNQLPSVIVVDDEGSVRWLLHRWLTDWGYDVRMAATADEGLALMIAQPAAIVLCDVIMPGRDGLWLTTEIRSRWPDTAVVMASGAQDLATVSRTRREGAVAFIPKPFGREMVWQALMKAASPTA